MPAIGLGVYQSAPGAETYDAVISALRIGYRHIDTAQVYGNEADVGRAVAESGINRQDLFLTTKLWKSEWGYDRARASIQESLQASGRLLLGLMPLLVMSHWEG